MVYEKSILLEVIGDSPENRILDFLLEGYIFEYNLSNLVEGCELSRGLIFKSLTRLVNEGSVVKKQKKRGFLYKINSENKRIKILYKLECDLLKESFKEVEEEYKKQEVQNGQDKGS